MSAGLTLETLNTILSGTNHFEPRLKFKPRLKFFKFGLRFKYLSILKIILLHLTLLELKYTNQRENIHSITLKNIGKKTFILWEKNLKFLISSCLNQSINVLNTVINLKIKTRKTKNLWLTLLIYIYMLSIAGKRLSKIDWYNGG